MQKAARASAVIITYDRPQSLAGALAALTNQTVPVEIVVVHDGDKHAPTVDALAEQAGARLLRVPQGGLANARNRGAEHATHDIVLGLDDDCEPIPDWAERMVKAFDNGADVVAGGVVNADANDRYGAATQLIHDHLMETPGSDYATTNNIGARRSIIAEVPFDATYMTAGEDRDWCRRVADAGHPLTRVPEALVLHRQQLTFKTFIRKHVTYGRGSARYRAEHDRRRKPARWYAALIARGFRHDLRTGALVTLAQAAGAYGALKERRQRAPR